MDETEEIRRRMVSDINSNPKTREELEKEHGEVYDTEQLTRRFKVIAFRAPFVIVDTLGIRGTLMFQHHPRFYFGYKQED